MEIPEQSGTIRSLKFIRIQPVLLTSSLTTVQIGLVPLLEGGRFLKFSGSGLNTSFPFLKINDA